MYTILRKEPLNPTTDLFEIQAPKLSKKARAGQFVVIRVDEPGERIPLTLADWDAEKGSITLVVMKVGTSTHKLAALSQGESILDLVGPLGIPSEVERFGTVVCVGGGVGIAPVYPIARALKEAGNRVLAIIGARSRELLFWEDRMRSASDELVVTTDDGSYGRKGLVTEPLQEYLEAYKEIRRVVAIGPAVMMKFCSLTTKPFEVPTIVSLNSIMVDGTGMCGGCRISANQKTKFACVDGPEFDGHQVDWDILLSRQRVYLGQEKESLHQWESSRCGKQTVGA